MAAVVLRWWQSAVELRYSRLSCLRWRHRTIRASGHVAGGASEHRTWLRTPPGSWAYDSRASGVSTFRTPRKRERSAAEAPAAAYSFGGACSGGRSEQASLSGVRHSSKPDDGSGCARGAGWDSGGIASRPAFEMGATWEPAVEWERGGAPADRARRAVRAPMGTSRRAGRCSAGR